MERPTGGEDCVPDDRAPLSLVVPLANLYPAFTVLLGVLVLRERPRPVLQLGLGMALVPIFLITC